MSRSGDAYGRPITIDGIGTTYDALGRMVEQNRSGTYKQIEYSPTGFKMQVVTGGINGAYVGFVPLPGGSVGFWNGGPPIYQHPDWLGSGRLMSTTSRTVYDDVAYAPFGETYAQSGTPDFSFTGMNQDTSSNLYDFPAREYGIQGRWPSPDPLGLGAVDPSNPQTWNRYAYVANNPLAATDPTGQFLLVNPAAGGPCVPCDIGIGIFDLFSFFFSLFGGAPPPPQAAPPPPGGYGAGIDPYGTWDEKWPAGVQVYPSSITGIPNGCTYGTGSCGGGAYGFFGPLAGAGAGGVCVIIEPCGISVGTVTVIATVATVAALLINHIYQSKKHVGPPPTNAPKPPQNPADPPGPGWKWVGKGAPGSSEGSWVNPGTGEVLHPDLGHGAPIGPHWDYTDPLGRTWRIS